MRLREIILEKVINLNSIEDKRKYSEQVWDIMQTSYAPVGGFSTASSIDELVTKFPLWKIVFRNGKITAAKIYKNQFGRKAVALGSDGTLQGIKDAKMLLKSDATTGRMWGEASGRPEHLYKSYGAKPIPAKYASLLTGKPIISYNPDGYHYTRLINGHPYEKIIYGVVNLSPEEVELFRNNGVNFQELPDNIKTKNIEKKKSMKIIYLHGYKSNGNSFKSKSLREQFGTDNVESPNLPLDPSGVESTVTDILNKNNDTRFIFIGTSLGGFWANYFAQKYNMPCVLVNPAFEPSVSLSKYGEPENILNGYRVREEIIDKKYNGSLVNLFVAKDDPILSYEQMINAYPNAASVTATPTGGHRFDSNWEMVLDKVSQLLK